MKAVLVIDTPENCEECRLKYLDTGDDAYFGMNVYRCVLDGAEINRNERWDDCPLRPLSSPLEENHNLRTNDREEEAFKEGFNRCLEVITGGSE